MIEQLHDPVFWDHEDSCLIDEMPPELGWPIAKGRQENAGFVFRLRLLESAFQDLASLTFATGLAAIVATHDADSKAAVARQLINWVSAEPLFTKPTLKDWYLLLTTKLNHLIHEWVVDRGLPLRGILAHMHQVQYRHSILVAGRNYYSHEFSAATEPPQDEARRLENDFRQDILATVGYWWEYSLGYIDGATIGFAKPRLGCLTLNPVYFSGLPHPSATFSGAPGGRDLLPAVLIDETEKRLYYLGPFVNCERVHKPFRIAKGYTVEFVYRALTFRSDDVGMRTGDVTVRKRYKEQSKSISLWSGRFPKAGEHHAFLGERLRDADLVEFTEALSTESEAACRTLDLDVAQQAEIFGAADRETECLEFELIRPDGSRVFLKPVGSGRVEDDSGHRAIVNSIGACGVIKAKALGDAFPDLSLIAVKILRLGFRSAEARFDVEKDFLSGIPQVMGLPHVVRYLGSGTVRLRSKTTSSANQQANIWHNRPFIAMEYVGDNLRARIRRSRGVLTHLLTSASRQEDLLKLEVVKHVARALYMVERISGALAELYTRIGRPFVHAGVSVHFLHRDIKPENLLDAGHGEIRLCDFNSAFVPSERIGDRANAAAGLFFSAEEVEDAVARGESVPDSRHLSRQYCAPEVWSWPGVYSETADVFSVGMVANELLWGEPRDTQREIADHFADYATGHWALYTEPAALESSTLSRVIAEVINDVASFVAAATEGGQQLWFDLRELVCRATASAEQSRWTMLELHKHAILAGRALRVYTTHRCREHIKRVLESGSLSELHDAMLFIRAAFGYQSETLSLVKCEEECRRDSDGPCLLKEIGRAAEALGLIGGSIMGGTDCGGDDEGVRTILNEREVKRILADWNMALASCVSLVDAPPSDAAKGTYHHRFRDVTEFWLQQAFLGLLIVESSPGGRRMEKQVISHEASSVAEDLLRFMVTMGQPAAGRPSENEHEY